MKNFAWLFCLVLLLQAGFCDRVTGGGTLDGVNGQASIGFNGNGCNPANFSGQVQYKDQDGGQKLRGNVVFARHCLVETDCPVCDPLRISLGFPLTLNDYEVTVDYRSTNPSMPGDGTATFCFTDNGEGSQATDPDTAIVQILSGPYAGYLNHGNVQGQVQLQGCPKGLSQ